MKNWNWLVCVITVVVAGCGTGQGTTVTSAASPELTTITVAAIPTVDLAALYIAQDENLFARQGLRVRIEKIASSKAITAAQMAGQVDISAGAYVSYIAAQAEQGARFRILAEASTLQPETRALLTTGNSAITSVAGLVGKKIGVNGTNSVGTLLISALLQDNGISPKAVNFVTDPSGFPSMPASLRQGVWDAAFLAEPYVTMAESDDGEQVLADLDQGATLDFPMDGYIATQAWAHAHPKTVAAFVRAIEAGQQIANTDRPAVEAAMQRFDALPANVTASMALPGFPIGPVDRTRMQRAANAMLEFGMLGPQYTAAVRQGTLIGSMVGGSLPGRPPLRRGWPGSRTGYVGSVGKPEGR